MQTNLGGTSKKRKDTQKRVFSFLTKSILADGINPSSMDEITCVMKSDFVGLEDGFNLIETKGFDFTKGECF